MIRSVLAGVSAGCITGLALAQFVVELAPQPTRLPAMDPKCQARLADPAVADFVEVRAAMSELARFCEGLMVSFESNGRTQLFPLVVATQR